MPFHKRWQRRWLRAAIEAGDGTGRVVAMPQDRSQTLPPRNQVGESATWGSTRPGQRPSGTMRAKLNCIFSFRRATQVPEAWAPPKSTKVGAGRARDSFDMRSSAIAEWSSGRWGPKPPAGRQSSSRAPDACPPKEWAGIRCTGPSSNELDNQPFRRDTRGMGCDTKLRVQARRERTTVRTVRLSSSTTGHSRPVCHGSGNAASQIGHRGLPPVDRGRRGQLPLSERNMREGPRTAKERRQNRVLCAETAPILERERRERMARREVTASSPVATARTKSPLAVSPDQ